MLNTKEYDYSYANRIGNALTEPLYKLYKADTKYLETLDSKVRNVTKHVFDATCMLLLNMVVIPLSLPLWFIGKAIVQYTSPKCMYSPLPKDATNSSIKADLLAMVKDHKEETIAQVFSHGAWYSLYDYRMEPNRAFGAIPGLESVRNTHGIVEKIHSFLEQKMISTKLSDSNRLIATIQKKLHVKEIPEKDYTGDLRSLRSQNPDASLVDLMDIIQKAKNREMFGDNAIEKPMIKDSSKSVEHSQNQESFRNYLVALVSKNHNLPLEEAVHFVAKNFYSSNNITYQGVHCLLRGIGVLS